ncbi:bifunctional oligoribonuclease/PAP phosphatase NrnA [Macrococcoides canis]|uniref:Bifunctional oligoribonuclease/PAP phosphatase NrnA n=1 Tax=Macrococcoides canis TaxID=1855823 RepID=A0A4R6C7X9_9STAP|nr:bifunctional oligoribonuclease/PAP phosphatase NrnA [Macrococcus canis]TDM18570.1 bifunctional oligoribonuclease/PAP phosphatase NrnA [Macrococcus canis]TDM21385.1 bifunctional oligoribonuclease/PAP phosphatase NrnA [Macrococcus canis]TDM31521.1 bifunctional oligoribonuclease/PAP phosphatase NrnA [Macrococcus canis]TDM43004.1 bifunctional oligoribonuclease/PAP phosphatase NrnA [Macrococcus canis]
MNKQDVNALINEINAYDTIIIFRHVRPDPDALGSQIGLKHAIKRLYPNKRIFAVGSEVENLKFIGNMDTLSDKQFDGALAIVLDTANAPRIDDSRYTLCDKVIKVDHHPPEDQYGELNIVDTTASSTSEIIFEILTSLGYGSDYIDTAVAKCLYMGIVGDTGRFLFNNTTSRTMEIAAELLKFNIEHTKMINQMQERDASSMKFQGFVLQNFNIDAGVGSILITKEILDTFNITASDASLFVNAFSDAKGIKAWAYAVDEGDEIRVRLRSKAVVINTLAAQYNGGGHPLASGASVYSVTEYEQLLTELKNLVNG